MSEGEHGGPMSMHVRNGNLRGVADAACAALAVVGRGIGSALANLSAALHVSPQARMRGTARVSASQNLARSCYSMAQFSPAGTCRPAWKSRSGSVLDLQLHRVAADLSVCRRLVGEVQGQRSGRGWSTHTRIQFRARRRQCSESGEGSRSWISDCDRQSLRDLGCVHEPILTYAIRGGCQNAYSTLLLG
jgi:hypothetical protein